GARAIYRTEENGRLVLSYLGGKWNASDSVHGLDSDAIATAAPNNVIDCPLNGLFVSFARYTYDEGGTSFVSDTATFDTVTDALGRTTQTYKDHQGRVRETLYADGSFTGTYYSDPTLRSPVSAPDDWLTDRDGEWGITEEEGWPEWLESEARLPE